MTPQNKVLIDLIEIGRLDVTCKCGSIMTLQLPKQDLREFVSCVGCNERLWDGIHDQTYIRVLGIMRSMSNWKEIASSAKFSLGFSLDASRVEGDEI